jgi:hypothetical protein
MGPSPRDSASMAFDPATGQLILFGGENNTGVLGDTWNWDGILWTELVPMTPSPDPRASASMAFDPSTGQLILFGGVSEIEDLNDTWNWDGTTTTWTELLPATSPPVRDSASMAFDPATGQLILFGGENQNNSVIFGDTWVWGIPIPTVTLVSPNFGPESGGTTVTITGTNFICEAIVNFGPNLATDVTIVSMTEITAVSPAGTGTVDVTVTTPGGTSMTSSADLFTYVPPPPTVTGISPSFGPASGGTSVIITGTNFTGATAVMFGSISASSFTVISPTQITAVSPPGIGTVNVTVTTPGGTSMTSPADQFIYVHAPTVTGISPNSGPTNGGTYVTITGTNFTGASVVKFGDQAAKFTVNSPTQITAISPASTEPGTVDVTVSTPGGTSMTSSADQFTYILLPPANVQGHQVKNLFATQTDLINILTWQAPSQGETPVAYKIFKNAELTKLIGVVYAHDQNQFKFEVHNRRENHTYTYYLVAVDATGHQSAAVIVTVGIKMD